MQELNQLAAKVNSNSWLRHDPAATLQDPVAAASKQRKTYTFCMCPGGQIVPTATEAGGLCLNGMSFSRRNSEWANSAIVQQVEESDWAPYEVLIAHAEFAN